MLAVIKTGGKQYTVKEGSIIDVELLSADVGSAYTFKDVLLISEDGKLKVGAPTVEGAAVESEVVEIRKGKTVLVFKRKPRKDYRKRIGHRQKYTRVKITKIIG